MPAVVNPADLLRKLADLQEQKDDEYRFSWRHFGPIMAALFPEGLTLYGARDFGRFAVMTHIVSKLHRYALNFETGGHQDSLKDLAVYAAMLASLDDANKP
jgi:Cdc6-like AAA superfamily ATPase